MDNSGKCPLKALLCLHTLLFPLLADYVSRGDLLVGGVGEGKVEGKQGFRVPFHMPALMGQPPNKYEEEEMVH